MSDVYVFSAAERDRISAVEDLLDDGTMRLITRLGIGPGARCLEVGAGGGSIARWLAELAGAEGSVVATDVDIRFMASTEGRPDIEIRRHDIVRDPLEEAAFDFVHARLVLELCPSGMVC